MDNNTVQGRSLVGNVADNISNRIYFTGKAAVTLVETIYHVGVAILYTAGALVSSAPSLEARKVELWEQTSKDFDDFRDYIVAAVLTGVDPLAPAVPKKIPAAKKEEPAVAPPAPKADEKESNEPGLLGEVAEGAGNAVWNLGAAAVGGVKNAFADLTATKEKKELMDSYLEDFDKLAFKWTAYLKSQIEFDVGRVVDLSNPPDATVTARLQRDRKSYLDEYVLGQFESERDDLKADFKSKLSATDVTKLKDTWDTRRRMMASVGEELKRANANSWQLAAGKAAAPGGIAAVGQSIWGILTGLGDIDPKDAVARLKAKRFAITSVVALGVLSSISALSRYYMPILSYPITWLGWRHYALASAAVGGVLTYVSVLDAAYAAVVTGFKKARIDHVFRSALGIAVLAYFVPGSDYLNWTMYGVLSTYIGFRTIYNNPLSRVWKVDPSSSSRLTTRIARELTTFGLWAATVYTLSYQFTPRFMTSTEVPTPPPAPSPEPVATPEGVNGDGIIARMSKALNDVMGGMGKSGAPQAG